MSIYLVEPLKGINTVIYLSKTLLHCLLLKGHRGKFMSTINLNHVLYAAVSAEVPARAERSAVGEDSATSGGGRRKCVLLACEPLKSSNAANWILTVRWVPSEPDTALHINIPHAIINHPNTVFQSKELSICVSIKNTEILIETEGQVASLPLQNKQVLAKMLVQPIIL